MLEAHTNFTPGRFNVFEIASQLNTIDNNFPLLVLFAGK